MSNAKELGAKIALLVATTFICLEIAGGAIAWTNVGLFYSRKETDVALAKVTPDQYERFRNSAHHVSSVWQPKPSTEARFLNCLAQPIDASYDTRGARQYRGFDGKAAEILLIGDSYTHGDEVNDDETIAAHLHKETGLMVANLGVGNYSPVQALLRGKAKREEFPAARSIVLGIMYENIRRNVNSHVFAFWGSGGSVFDYRPYVKGNDIKLAPAAIFDGFDQFKQHTVQTIKDDFWTMPTGAWPYSASLVRAATARPFRTRAGAWVLKHWQRQYWIDFREPEMAHSLAVVARDFVQWSHSVGLDPIVVFIPQNRRDVLSAAQWIETTGNVPELRGKLFNAEMADTDWSRYNLKPNGDCHPSSYGYSRIAAVYASILKKNRNPRQSLN